MHTSRDTSPDAPTPPPGQAPPRPPQPSGTTTLDEQQTRDLAAVLPHGCPDGLPAEPDDHLTHVARHDVDLGPAGTLAVLTLDSADGRRPTTLGPRSLLALRTALLDLGRRADAGQVAAVAVTGRPGCFVAGADLALAQRLRSLADARALAELGHATLRLLGELPVPTVAWITGHALGGGLEVALHCDHRVVAASVRSLGLPEAHLGIVPGWGGAWLLPRTVDLADAVDLAVLAPLQGNRLTTAARAAEIGLVDAVLPDEDFARHAARWTADLLAVEPDPTVHRATRYAAAQVPGVRPEREDDPLGEATAAVHARLHGAAPSYQRALDLLAAGADRDRDTGFAAEDDVLAELLVSDTARAALYAVGLSSRAPRPTLDDVLPRQVRRVGIVGAGLMAAQLAVLLSARLDAPVALREIDEERAAAGRDRVRALVERSVERGRLDRTAADALLARITVGTDLAALADADLVVEAVTEVLDVKRQVLADLEEHVSPTCVLATNTSALSVAAMASGLRHPRRVVGLHFFNPVDRMPLVEVVATAQADPVAVTTAADVARRCGKTVVRTTDRPGFVVNRVLLRLLSDVLGAVADGAPVTVADTALDPLGLPMRPFALLDLVGLSVAEHVLTSLHQDLGPRFRLSPALTDLAAAGTRVSRTGPDGTAQVDPDVQHAVDAHRPGASGGSPAPGSADHGPTSPDGPAVLERVARGLAEEIGLLLDEGVVPGPEQVDLALLLGAGWPVHLGGICPYLDRAGWSHAVLGRRLLPPGIADAPR